MTKRAPLADLGQQARDVSRQEKAAKVRAERDPPETPPPDMSALHTPVRRGWGRPEWAAWMEASSAFFDKRQQLRYDNWDPRGGAESDGEEWFEDHTEQCADACNWAAPDQILVKVSIGGPAPASAGEAGAAAESDAAPRERGPDLERRALAEAVQLRRGDKQTLRSFLQGVCAAAGVDHEAFKWTMPMSDPCEGGVVSLPKFPDDMLLKKDELAVHELWDPHQQHRWRSDGVYGAELVGIPKVTPAAPTAEPSYKLLKCPPPAGDASAAAWEAWQEAHSITTSYEAQAIHAATRWRCPSRLPVKLVGMWHSHTLELPADEPLVVAAAAFCAAAPAEAQPLTPADILLLDIRDEEYRDDFLDQRTNTLRELWDGVRDDGPITLRVRLRDEERLAAEREAKFGSIPDGFHGLGGSDYLLSDTEADWLLSEAHGLEMHNRVIEEALSLHQGTDCRGGYNPVLAWLGMMDKLGQMLASVVRSPRGGHTADSALLALDRLTGFLLVTASSPEWREDARGRVMMADPACRAKTRALITKMEAAVVKVVPAVKEAAAGARDPPHGFGSERGLAQLRRLVAKLAEEYKGVGGGRARFGKAMKLLR